MIVWVYIYVDGRMHVCTYAFSCESLQEVSKSRSGTMGSCSRKMFLFCSLHQKLRMKDGMIVHLTIIFLVCASALCFMLVNVHVYVGVLVNVNLYVFHMCKCVSEIALFLSKFS